MTDPHHTSELWAAWKEASGHAAHLLRENAQLTEERDRLRELLIAHDIDPDPATTPIGTSPPVRPPGTVLAGVQRVPWDDEAAVSFAVALDAISQVIGLYSMLLTREQHDDKPNHRLIAEWSQAMDTWIDRETRLLPDDTDEVADVRAECAKLITQLRGQI